MMKKGFAVICILLVVFMVVPASKSQKTTDEDAIKQTALDYIEGWYEGNVERMERALHPELAKRAVFTDKTSGNSRLHKMDATMLVEATKTGNGKNTPVEKQMKEVTILDKYENVACVKIIATDWIDYLQVAKFDGRWVIVNVLWEMKPKQK
jgi:hypothetical protein